MATGSRYTSYFIKEAESGVTPTSGTLKVFRATKSGLDINIATLESAEIRNDAEVADFRLGTRSVSGTATAELSYETFDDLLSAALRGAWASNVVTGGITRQSFTFVDYNADITDLPYTIYRGCEVNTLTLTVSASGLITVEFGIVGRTMETSATLPAGLTVGTRTTSAPMDGFSGSVKMASSSLDVVTELTIAIENGIEPRFVIGSKYSIRPGSKRRNVSGTLTAYYEDSSLRQQYLNEEEGSLVIQVIDSITGAGYEFSQPRVKLTEAPRPIDGEGDIMVNISYKGLLSASAGHSIKISKLAALAFSTNLTATKSVTAGQALTLTVAVTGGSTPYTYKWTKGGAAISGATSATYTKAGSAVADSGVYACEVKDASGRVIKSTNCTVTVA